MSFDKASIISMRQEVESINNERLEKLAFGGGRLGSGQGYSAPKSSGSAKGLGISSAIGKGLRDALSGARKGFGQIGSDASAYAGRVKGRASRQAAAMGNIASDIGRRSVDRATSIPGLPKGALMRAVRSALPRPAPRPAASRPAAPALSGGMSMPPEVKNMSGGGGPSGRLMSMGTVAPKPAPKPAPSRPAPPAAKNMSLPRAARNMSGGGSARLMSVDPGAAASRNAPPNMSVAPRPAAKPAASATPKMQGAGSYAQLAKMVGGGATARGLAQRFGNRDIQRGAQFNVAGIRKALGGSGSFYGNTALSSGGFGRAGSALKRFGQPKAAPSGIARAGASPMLQRRVAAAKKPLHEGLLGQAAGIKGSIANNALKSGGPSAAQKLVASLNR